MSLKSVKNAPVSMHAHGKTLAMPMSHDLPLILAQSPLYDSLLNRLAHYLRQRDGFVSIVDVGANIGDTVIACRLESSDTALCIEPNGEYWPYLQQNLRLSEGNCLSSQSLVGRTDGVLNVSASTSGGTARYSTGTTGFPVAVRTIPSLMSTAGMEQCNLLKIDTDGHDFDCLRGAEKLLNHSTPAILFEADLFGNTRYGEELFDIVSMLVKMRYTLFIFYTNDGCFFNYYTNDTINQIYKAAFYQTIKNNTYFDVLALADQAFLRNELDYFVDITKDADRNKVAHSIAASISADPLR